MKRTFLLIMILVLLLLSLGWSVRVAIYAQHNTSTTPQFTTQGNWQNHQYDLVYTVAFSRFQQPNGPLVVYRASGANIQTNVPVIALQREPLTVTPLFFPSPDGRYLALSTPLYGNLSTSSLTLLSSDGATHTLLLPQGIATNDQLVWSTNSQSLYYHTVVEQKLSIPGVQSMKGSAVQHSNTVPLLMGYDEIHRIDLQGHDITVLHRPFDGSSLRLVGVDATGALILTLARFQQAASLLRIEIGNSTGSGPFQSMHAHTTVSIIPLPSDILPGNVLRVSSDGMAVECERILQWQPLRYTLVRINLNNGYTTAIPSLFGTARFGASVTPLSGAPDGRVQVMVQHTAVRSDLAQQGIANVAAQEVLILADTSTGATQRFTLPPGAQVIQAFWTTRSTPAQLHVVPQMVLASLLAFHKRLTTTNNLNASTQQQDAWMLLGHAGTLTDAPTFSKMCYGTCPQGANGAPHVSAAILRGIAYTESNWHQFNTSDYHVNGEAVGTPIESWDGGWGEFQQTWGMPPQCSNAHNCRSDVAKVQYDQSYNIGVGVQSLISAWNGTAGVAGSDPNDPYKANHWFFATWAYNGSYGNNPNDVPSSVYGHWYPGAPFRSIYEEYVWYFAAHPQAWTDAYLPSLGSSLLPPQSAFVNTSDSFVACVTCTIPDWTTGSYDREWVGVGAPNVQTVASFQTTFNQSGGEDTVGLPQDDGSGASVHRWGTGWAQNFAGGSYQTGTIFSADGASTAYWVYGGVWSQYRVDGGPTGCHGFPTSALLPYTNTSLGLDTYLRQTFQTGSITWDATTRTVAMDVCQ